MTINLYETATTDVPITVNSSYFRALKFRYTNSARTTLKKVWVRNDGDEVVSGNVYANGFEEVGGASISITLDPMYLPEEIPEMPEDSFSTNRMFTDSLDEFDWWASEDSSPMPEVSGGYLKPHGTPLNIIGREMFTATTDNSVLHPNMFLWKLRWTTLVDGAGLTVGWYDGEPVTPDEFSWGTGFQVIDNHNGSWSIWRVRTTPGTEHPTELVFADELPNQLFVGSASDCLQLLNDCYILMYLNAVSIGPGPLTNRGTIYNFLSNGQGGASELGFHDEDFDIRGVFTAMFKDGFEIDYWGFGYPRPVFGGGEGEFIGQDTWFRFAADFGDTPGSWERQHPFTLQPGQQKPMWIKLTVPLTSTPQQRIDLRVKATYS